MSAKTKLDHEIRYKLSSSTGRFPVSSRESESRESVELEYHVDSVHVILNSCEC